MFFLPFCLLDIAVYSCEKVCLLEVVCSIHSSLHPIDFSRNLLLFAKPLSGGDGPFFLLSERKETTSPISAMVMIIKQQIIEVARHYILFFILRYFIIFHILYKYFIMLEVW